MVNSDFTAACEIPKLSRVKYAFSRLKWVGKKCPVIFYFRTWKAPYALTQRGQDKVHLPCGS